MSPKIHRPTALVLLLVLIGGLTAVAVISANMGRDIKAEYTPLSGLERPSPISDKKGAARYGNYPGIGHRREHQQQPVLGSQVRN